MAKSGKSYGRRDTGETLADHRAGLGQALKDLPPVTVITGAEEFLRRQALEQLLAAWRAHYAAGDEITLYGRGGPGDTGDSLPRLLAELQGGSLFAREKLVLVRRAEGLLFGGADETEPKAKAGDPATERLADQIRTPNSGVWLVIECEKLNKARKLGKVLTEAAHLIPCPAAAGRGEAASWLAKAAHELGKDLEPGASELLLDTHGFNLGALHGEVEKLAIYVGEATTIRECDVRDQLAGLLDYDVFGLTNAVEERDLPKALTFARRVIFYGSTDTGGKRVMGEGAAHRALAMLAGTVEKLLVARALTAGGEDEGEIASQLQVSPFRARNLIRSAGNFTLSELRETAQVLAEQIRASHDTGADPALALDRAVLAACRSKRQARADSSSRR